MDFVIYSRNFLPLNDAEGYCTARFANALASSGHHVHMVTMDHPQQVPQDVCDELMPMVKTITRVPSKGAVKSYYPRIRYQTPEWDAIDYGESIRCLTRVLSGYDKPILISRMAPAASGIVSWHCRKYAWKWIHHFSDPYPLYLKGGFLGGLMNLFTHRWARRFIHDSDLCTVTCNEVLRFFDERLGRIDHGHFHLLPHIGDPFLKSSGEPLPIKGKRIIAHTGNCYDGRYASELVSELQLLSKRRSDLALLQAGNMGAGDVELIQQSGLCFHKLELTNPRMASSIFEQANVNLVIDLKTDLGHTPFIPSKFVYLLFTDRPIVVYARPDSWMYSLVQDYPEAGIHFADVQNRGELAQVLDKALSSCDSARVDRSGIRKLFSARRVIEDFLGRVAQL